jgi:dihydrodipicolinate synthase/N-acetylneuraminate lyase
MTAQANAPVWHGVHVATALPFHDDLTIDYDAYAEHVRFLADGGCDGVCPNGSLGEYQTLTADERAAEAGASSVLLLPPNAYRADRRAVVAHYREVAKVGLPIVAYNNPLDTKVDLTPELLAELHHEGLIVAVKEFSGDVRRAYELAERAPGLDLLIGSDDVLLELAIAGAVGWIAGYPNMIPRATVELYRLAVAGDVEKALPIYRDLHPLLRWDSKTEFVQSIKLSMDLAGRKGGPCRPPRVALTTEQEAQITRQTREVLAKGYR